MIAQKTLNKQGHKGAHSLIVRRHDNWTFKLLFVLASIVQHDCGKNISL